MIGPFTSLFPKKPKDYSEKSFAVYSVTEYYSSYIKTEEQLFTDKKTEFPPDTYYVFNYRYDGKNYSFKILLKENKEYNLEKKHKIYINPFTPTNIWFEYKEICGFLLKPLKG